MTPCTCGARRAFDPGLTLALLLCSALAVGMVTLRIGYSGSITYTFLVWNLILAWVPYLLSMVAARVDRLRRRGLGWAGTLLLGMGWLLFFPNAPYLVTDLMHLRERAPIPLWYDALLLMSFAWTGCLLGFASLLHIQQIVARRSGALAGWLVVGAAGLLGGMGIYLGRFLRWNSWDLLLAPDAVLATLLERLANPLDHPRFVQVTLLIGCFLIVCYGSVLSLARAVRNDP